MTIQLSVSVPVIAAPVFVSGSRSIARLPLAVANRLGTILDRNMPVLIGDARGADAAVQRFLADRQAQDVTVYCAGPSPRANLGRWQTRVIPSDAPKRSAAYHAAKDRAMAEHAGSGLVIWDRRSRGSLANIHRLCARHCFVLIWVAPDEAFLTLRSDADRTAFVEAHPCRTD